MDYANEDVYLYAGKYVQKIVYQWTICIYSILRKLDVPYKWGQEGAAYHANRLKLIIFIVEVVAVILPPLPLLPPYVISL